MELVGIVFNLLNVFARVSQVMEDVPRGGHCWWLCLFVILLMPMFVLTLSMFDYQTPFQCTVNGKIANYFGMLRWFVLILK